GVGAGQTFERNDKRRRDGGGDGGEVDGNAAFGKNLDDGEEPLVGPSDVVVAKEEGDGPAGDVERRLERPQPVVAARVGCLQPESPSTHATRRAVHSCCAAGDRKGRRAIPRTTSTSRFAA